MPGLVLIKSLAADHSGVVAAVLQLRQVELVPALGAGGLQVSADAAVGRHASGHRQSAVALHSGGRHGPGHQRVAHRPAKAGGKVRQR